MKRLNKTLKLETALLEVISKIENTQTWYLITESWCGDASQLVSLFNEIATTQPKIELVVVLRDENLGLMDQFLTNGGRSIPIVVFTDATTNTVLGKWGPRPAEAQTLVLSAKADNLPFQQMSEKLHTWYAQDGTKSTQLELATYLGEM
jgi:hypothetical protein